jgi:hypothetical protein
MSVNAATARLLPDFQVDKSKSTSAWNGESHERTDTEDLELTLRICLELRQRRLSQWAGDRRRAAQNGKWLVWFEGCEVGGRER